MFIVQMSTKSKRAREHDLLTDSLDFTSASKQVNDSGTVNNPLDLVTFAGSESLQRQLRVLVRKYETYLVCTLDQHQQILDQWCSKWITLSGSNRSIEDLCTYTIHSQRE